MDNLTFLTGAMFRITSSLDIQDALVETFRYLAYHFPIEAISLHQYSDRKIPWAISQRAAVTKKPVPNENTISLTFSPTHSKHLFITFRFHESG